MARYLVAHFSSRVATLRNGLNRWMSRSTTVRLRYAGPHYPEDAVDHHAVVVGGSSGRRLLWRRQRAKLVPLRVGQLAGIHGAKYGASWDLRTRPRGVSKVENGERRTDELDLRHVCLEVGLALANSRAPQLRPSGHRRTIPVSMRDFPVVPFGASAWQRSRTAHPNASRSGRCSGKCGWRPG